MLTCHVNLYSHTMEHMYMLSLLGQVNKNNLPILWTTRVCFLGPRPWVGFIKRSYAGRLGGGWTSVKTKHAMSVKSSQSANLVASSMSTQPGLLQRWIFKLMITYTAYTKVNARYKEYRAMLDFGAPESALESDVRQMLVWNEHTRIHSHESHPHSHGRFHFSNCIDSSDSN